MELSSSKLEKALIPFLKKIILYFKKELAKTEKQKAHISG